MTKEPDQGGNPLDLKAHNRAVVLRALRQSRGATRQELSRKTGLSQVTIGHILDALVEEGSARPGARTPSAGGRPSQLFEFVADHALVLTLFAREVAGQDTLCVRVANLYGTVVEAWDTPLLASGLGAFEPAIDRMLARYPAIRALGFALPGVEFEGRIEVLDYPALVGTPFVGHFSQRYRLPVLFENDVNVAVLGRGVETGAADVEVYLYFPRRYAPGAGIRMGERLLKGHRHFAGEVGFLPLGLPWGSPELTATPEAACEAVAKVVVSLASVVAPDSVVLFGEFLTPSHLEAIVGRVAGLLPSAMVPTLTLATDFDADVQAGLIGLTLNLVETSSPFAP